jgi:hypothetical protein
VGDQQRKRIVVSSALVDEMDVETVDLGGEVVEPVQRGFACAPVVFTGPVIGQLTGVGERDALTPVVDAFRLRPSGAREPGVQVVKIGVGDLNAEWVDLGLASLCSHAS